MEIKKVFSWSSGCNAQSHLFNKCGVGLDTHIYHLFKSILVESKIWIANKENSYFCWSRKIWLFFLTALFIYEELYRIAILWWFEQNLLHQQPWLIARYLKLYGELFDMHVLRNSERRRQSVAFIHWQRFAWLHTTLVHTHPISTDKSKDTRKYSLQKPETQNQSALLGVGKNIGHDQIWCENLVVFNNCSW